MSLKFEKLTVLVVEDVLPMRKLVGDILSTFGVNNIFTAASGEAGFQAFF